MFLEGGTENILSIMQFTKDYYCEHHLESRHIYLTYL